VIRFARSHLAPEVKGKAGEWEAIRFSRSRLALEVEGKGDEHEATKKDWMTMTGQMWENCTVWLMGAPNVFRSLRSESVSFFFFGKNTVFRTIYLRYMWK
jgi:hypothetical protein